MRVATLCDHGAPTLARKSARRSSSSRCLFSLDEARGWRSARRGRAGWGGRHACLAADRLTLQAALAWPVRLAGCQPPPSTLRGFVGLQTVASTYVRRERRRSGATEGSFRCVLGRRSRACFAGHAGVSRCWLSTTTLGDRSVICVHSMARPRGSLSHSCILPMATHSMYICWRRAMRPNLMAISAQVCHSRVPFTCCSSCLVAWWWLVGWWLVGWGLVGVLGGVVVLCWHGQGGDVHSLLLFHCLG